MKIKKQLEDIARYDMLYLDRLSKIRLDRNERTFKWPQKVWREAKKVITPDVIMSYPELGPVYDKLAKVLNIRRGCMLLSHGSDVGLKSIFEVYINPGDEAIMLSPSYAMYPVYARIVGAKTVQISFLEDLTLPLERIIGAITSRTRILCLPNPNQPIERVFSKEELKRIFELSIKNDFLVIIDEAYHYFYPETAIPYIEENPNLIVTRSFSKAFGMAGLRAGLIISNESRIEELKKVKPISEINNAAAKLIEFFLGRMDVIYAYVRQVNQGREVVLRRSRKLKLPASGQAGNSVLLQLRDPEQVKAVVAKAKEEGILLKGPFEYPAVRHLRITLGPRHLMHSAMNIIERSLS